MKFRPVRIGIVLLLSCVAAAAQEAEYSVVPAKSKIEIHVSKVGFLKAFGHNHLIEAKQLSGRVQFDPKKIESSSVTLKVETKSLTVAGDEPEKDRQDVQATMSGEKVLDVAKYPEIAFSSADVSEVKQSDGGWTLTLSGHLKLHGVERPFRLPITLHIKGDELEAEGEISLLQTDYGIQPVKAGGGAVTVKNELKINFDIVAAK